MISCVIFLTSASFVLPLITSETERRVIFTVTEETTVGSLVGNLRKSLEEDSHFDHPAQINRAQFIHFSGGSKTEFFNVDEKTGDIFVKSRIDRELLCIQVLACCSGIARGASENYIASFLTSSQSSNLLTDECVLHTIVGYRDNSLMIDVYVLILDINDHTPIWDKSEYHLEVPEHTPIGDLFNLPQANDSDQAQENSILRYELREVFKEGFTHKHRSPAFILDSTPLAKASKYAKTSFELSLRVNIDFDRDEVNGYQYLLLAIDGGGNSHSEGFTSNSRTGTLSLNIVITDINDNAPMFDKEIEIVDVSEDVAIGTVIFQASATDKDPSDASYLRYEIEPSIISRSAELFSIESTTGKIKTRAKLDFENADMVTIPNNLLDTLTHIPGFNISVTITDGKHLARQTVIVRLMNVNDNAPLITLRHRSQQLNGRLNDIIIPENVEEGTILALISVEDADDRQTNTDQLPKCQLKQSGDEFSLTQARSRFNLITKKKLDRETSPQMHISIDCWDSGEPVKSSSKLINIILEDVNDSVPKFEQSVYYVTVKEGLLNQTSVIKLVAKDLDTKPYSNIRYRIIEEIGISSLDDQGSLYSAYDGLLFINETTGEVRTNTILDREVVASINCTIEASDGVHHSTTFLLINIDDVNDCVPQFEQNSYEFSVKENSPSHKKIGTVTAFDKDISNRFRQFRIFMREVNEDFDYLKAFRAKDYFLVQSNGEIFTRNDKLDRESIPVFNFEVVAQDVQTLNFSVAMVTVKLEDINDNSPRWIEPLVQSNQRPLILNVSAYTEVRTLLVKLKAVDPDEGDSGRVDYHIISGNELGLFGVEPITGELYVARSLLTNENSSQLTSQIYTLQIEAADMNERPRVNKTFLTINVRSDITPNVFSSETYRFNKNGFDRDLIIMMTMITITLIISIALIMAIGILRCRQIRPWVFRRRSHNSDEVTHSFNNPDSWKLSHINSIRETNDSTINYFIANDIHKKGNNSNDRSLARKSESNSKNLLLNISSMESLDQKALNSPNITTFCNKYEMMMQPIQPSSTLYSTLKSVKHPILYVERNSLDDDHAGMSSNSSSFLNDELQTYTALASRKDMEQKGFSTSFFEPMSQKSAIRPKEKRVQMHLNQDCFIPLKQDSSVKNY